jgi:acyl carrier protein
MDDAIIKANVRAAISETLLVSPEQIDENALISELADLDSLKFESLVVELEYKNGIILDPHDFISVVTVADLDRLVIGLVRKRAS